MRKRDREKLVKELSVFAEKFRDYVDNQLGGAIWYFEQNSEIKGFDFGYSVSQSASHLGKELKKLLDREAEKWSNERRKDRKRKR